MKKLLRHQHAAVALSDAGAHLSFLCDAGFGLHLFGSLSYLLASTVLVGMASSGSTASTATNFRILSVVNGSLHAAALALLLAALLAPRPPAR